jgi:pimeloyl-ACP methyl ester carboxylesterase
MSAAAYRVVEEWAARGRPLEVPKANTVVWEEGDGEPVVLLHGVPASSFIYRKVLPELAARGRRGVAFDFPGLGLAARPEAFDYTWSGLSAWTGLALDALGLERFHLVVHDIGGPIGFDLAARAPERIRSLTVLNTIVRVATFKRPWMMEPYARRRIGELVLKGTTEFGLERILRYAGMSSQIPSEQVRAYLPLLKRGDGGRAFLRIMRGFERTQAFEDRIVSALRDRPYPAQVVWGKDDPALTLAAKGEKVREVLGVEAIHRLPGKHFVMEDSPEPIAELVAAQQSV